MKHQHLFAVLSIFGSQAVLADLTCQDFIPHNWTSPLARLYLFDGDDYPPNSDPSTMPANLSATSPLTLAPQTSSGSIFHLKKCTSKSLNLTSSHDFGCEGPGKKKRQLRRRQDGSDCYRDGYECTKSQNTWIRIMDPAGHCFTWQELSPKLAHYNFIPCDPNPTNLSQILQASRQITYNSDGDYQPEDVCDWGVSFNVGPQIQVPYSDKYHWFQAWELAADNKTLVSESQRYPNDYFVYAEPHDPLTTYAGKKDNGLDF